MIDANLLIEKFILSRLESTYKIELDNLDRAVLCFNDDGTKVVVENEHGTQFEVEDLSQSELEIFYASLSSFD